MATTNKPVNVYLPKELEQSITEYCTEYSITRKDKSGNISPAWGTAILEILKQYFNGDQQSILLSNAPSNLLDEQVEAIKEEVRLALIPDFEELIKVFQEQLRGELLGRIEELEKMAISPQAELERLNQECDSFMLKAHEAQSEVEKLKAEVDPQPVVEAVPDVLATEEGSFDGTEEALLDQPVTSNNAATIPDDPEKVDAGENITVIDDELVTVEPMSSADDVLTNEPEVVPNTAIADDPKSTAQYREGLTGAALSKRLSRDAGGITKHYKKGDLPEWSKELDPDGIAWERKGTLYFPVKKKTKK